MKFKKTIKCIIPIITASFLMSCGTNQMTEENVQKLEYLQQVQKETNKEKLEHKFNLQIKEIIEEKEKYKEYIEELKNLKEIA